MRDSRTRFSFLDILRILGGILFLNAFYHGGSHQLQHGVSRKWLNTDYLKFRLFNANNPLNLTISELSLYNGTDKHLPIYLAIDGIVFDVSSSLKFMDLEVHIMN